MSGIDPDAVTVDALARLPRLQLAARGTAARFGSQGSPELLELVAFIGLRDVLPE